MAVAEPTKGPWHRRIGIIGNGTALSQEEQICSGDGVGVVILRHDGSEAGNANVQLMTAAPALRSVLTHLVRLIQESPDVRYYVGGHGSQMRELLCTAIAAVGFKGDPAEALKPAEHRRNDPPERERLMRRLEDLASKGKRE